ncbi:M48 family metallopeptidase [Marinobacter psychrophilus]|jgi:Zn-dependent protease with chaperone function|uniref:M48 family metallopeptidase n=1 Tax=Marinobacter psychrophilus TaxID=330734 RepID=UPI001B683FF9|nr:M48 family metallopeptidase [Marinobacter psychrophilus]MBQ0762840.1 M48 family metallopeptidase [Marinobacter psychrophilus]MBQ0846222.1 M48 family metallopeptidase [Marinobacter psychrophilus]
MAHSPFFQRQAKARRNTLLLVALFSTAVMLITLSVCVVGYMVTRSSTSALPFHHWLLTSHGLITAGASVALMGVGSLIRWIDLADGGRRVAEMVGAQPINPDTNDPLERRLRNIVEEMAIASGVAVPELYVMDQETGINAFVAGYSPAEAVMVVTHGALTQLTRDELQGVVGHEFSHILNGDMRLNVRLIALLAGILMIGQIGLFLARAGFYSGAVRTRRDSRGQFALGTLGVVLVVIGYAGVFCGRLIQAAVSRQRERLADASSVQFTRNPDGIGGALFKIGLQGSHLDTTRHASDMNHMCFGESTRMKFMGLLASHPPIEDRINALQPGLITRLRSRLRDTRSSEALRNTQAENSSQRQANTLGNAPGSSPESTQTSTPASALGFADPAPFNTRANKGSGSPLAGNNRYRMAADTPMSVRVGQVYPGSENYAKDLLGQLPATCRGLIYTRAGAVQLSYSLLIADLPAEQQQRYLALLPAHSVVGHQEPILQKLLPTVTALGAAARFPLLELAMPALRKLDPSEQQQLIRNVKALAVADQNISLFELALTSFFSRHLSPRSGRAVAVKHRRFQPVLPALRQLFSLLARASADNPQQAQALFRQAMAGFGVSGDAVPKILTSVSLRELSQALAELNKLSPLLKPAIIDASAECVSQNGHISVREYEMMRLVADQLDCPMPPLID